MSPDALGTAANTMITEYGARRLTTMGASLNTQLSALRAALSSLKTHLNSNICSAWEDPDFTNALANCKKLLENGETTANDLQSLIGIINDTANDITVELAKRVANS